MAGRDLRAFRKRAGITQSDLRAALRWNIWKIVQIENEDVIATLEDEAAYVAAVEGLKREKSEQEEVAA